MKKTVTLLLLIHCAAFFGQTKLASHPLELKKPSAYYQVLNAVNAGKQVFAFAADKEDLHVLKFNSALFFSDSLTVKRPEKKYEILVGYSFGENGNPFTYWASGDFKKIQAVECDFVKRTGRMFSYELPFKDETIAGSFTENNSFYILSQSEKDGFLKLYIFNNGLFTEKLLDFSLFKFTDEQNKPAKFDTILQDHPIEKMDTNDFNPLIYTVQKTKLYVENNRMLLSLDHNPVQTQLFQIDLSTFVISENIIPQPKLQNLAGKSNSYFYKDTLYQLRGNEQHMIFDIRKYPSGDIIKDYSLSENDSITFKNSPFYIQNGNQKPRDLKTTKKFLRRLFSSEIGLSVYENQGNNLITIGRAENVSSTGNILLGVTLGVGVALGGGGGNLFVGDMFDGQHVQSIYFESLLDKNMQHVPGQSGPLAIDHISEFLDQQQKVTSSTVYYKDFFIVGYYDAGANEYVLRKFQDGL